MNVVVTGKNMQVVESLTQRIKRAIEQLLQKYFSGRGEANIVLTKEASSFESDIKIHLPSRVVLHAHTRGHGGAASVFAETEEKIAKQLRRYKRRLNDFGRPENPALEATEDVLKNQDLSEDEYNTDEETHLVIAEHTQAIERLTVRDAVIRMDQGSLDHLLFKNVGNDRLNLMYRRPDGHYGWLNPEQ